MVAEILFLLKVSLCVTAFYLFYLFIKGTTFFTLNRMYLIIGLILSFIIPAIEFPVVSYDYHLPATDLLNPSPVPDTVIADDSTGRDNGEVLTPGTLVLGCYVIGLLVMFSRLISSLVSIIRLEKNSEVRYVADTAVLRTTIAQPFSFFKWIFLPAHENSVHILNHEKVHVRQWHTMDLLLTELVHAILWFNPIMIFYKRAIKIQHEYLADSEAIQNEDDLQLYLECMLKQIQVENFAGPISRFYSLTIKNRIIMMTKNKTSLKFSVLYFLALPIVCLLLFSFSKPLPVALMDDRSSFKDGQVVVVIDAGHGGSDNGGEPKDGISEKNFTMTFASMLAKMAEDKGVKVILTRAGDQTLPLQDRVKAISELNADAFISIHAGYDQEDQSRSGIQCFVSESNPKFTSSKRLAEQLVKQLQKLQGIRVNGIKQSNPVVLKTNPIPAVLLELGCLSNASDYNFVNESKSQRAMAEKILAAITDFAK